VTASRNSNRKLARGERASHSVSSLFSEPDSSRSEHRHSCHNRGSLPRWRSPRDVHGGRGANCRHHDGRMRSCALHPRVPRRWLRCCWNYLSCCRCTRLVEALQRCRQTGLGCRSQRHLRSVNRRPSRPLHHPRHPPLLLHRHLSLRHHLLLVRHLPPRHPPLRRLHRRLCLELTRELKVRSGSLLLHSITSVCSLSSSSKVCGTTTSQRLHRTIKTT
jgi:hypothetical protein